MLTWCCVMIYDRFQHSTYICTCIVLLRTDFITEGAQQPAVLSAEGLGLGPTVPRCLRRRTGVMVEGLQQLSRAETEALVMHIWQVWTA
jgi:hypothetical protein